MLIKYSGNVRLQRFFPIFSVIAESASPISDYIKKKKKKKKKKNHCALSSNECSNCSDR